MSNDVSAMEWATVNLQGQVTAGGSSAPCNVVSLHPTGVVLLPSMKGTAGMPMELELQPHDWPQPMGLPGTLVREGEFHGHYAWQVQFGQLSQPVTTAVLGMMGVKPPSVAPLPAEKKAPKDARRSYSGVFDDLPEMEVQDVHEARLDGELHRRDKQDLLKSVDKDNVKEIYKEALREMRESDGKDKKKKGWFR